MRKETLFNLIRLTVLALMLSSCGGASSDKATIVLSEEDKPPSDEEAAAFLMQATFGPTESSISELQQIGYSAWMIAQFNQPVADMVEETRALSVGTTSNLKFNYHSLEVFYKLAISGSDQLRQRAAFALSEIFVTSTIPSAIIRKSLLHASYKQIIQEGAFGNFRDLMEEVTYHPLMGVSLTYIGNQKANPDTGSAPDENYAREILQLFTIGLTELNEDGSVKKSGGSEIEIYDNDDITELAKVFTGLYWANKSFDGRVTLHNDEESDTSRLVMHDEYHSEGSKSFLGGQVEGSGDEDISGALDIIFNHANVAPFICTQLIQRLTYSNPHGSSYTSRCVNAFNTGLYTLPNGTVIGTGERGDLPPVWAAILLDDTARSLDRYNQEDYGKAREPIIGFIHWARVSDVNDFDVDETTLRGTLGDDDFGQTPYQSPSVFNFFRPGYVPAGTSMGDLNKVVPEFQVMTSTILVNYANTMKSFTTRASDEIGFVPHYTKELALAADPEALTNHINLLMTAGRMDEHTLEGIRNTLNAIELPDESASRSDALLERVRLAMLLAVTSSEFRMQF
ncbi:DUF1800 domain-containing protein [Psychromonas sp.]|nr:DUF1800 domain-containing protein [Psychromonas sp.]